MLRLDNSHSLTQMAHFAILVTLKQAKKGSTVTNQEILEYLEPVIETEFKLRDWQQFATELGFDPSEQAYEAFCSWLDSASPEAAE